jgi:hydroxyacylglutathione hydrolase
MAQEIHPIESSINTYYLIRDKGAVLFDAGYINGAKAFREATDRLGILPEEIELIVLSHGDFDHAGGAQELREITGAKIAIHERDRHYLEEGIFHWPRGASPWGKLSRATLKPIIQKRAGFPGVTSDLVLDDSDFSLEPYGIRGRVIHTPGHTYGSVSILLDSGDALVGCLAHNRFPFVLKPKLPIYADDLELLKRSWAKVIDGGAKTIYPGHGKPFPLEKILRYLN